VAWVVDVGMGLDVGIGRETGGVFVPTFEVIGVLVPTWMATDVLDIGRVGIGEEF
jgi:hypothetical protein